ncbi:MAG: hypothetical protein J5I98_04580 [Phaeodactylibacter sp.]|nr:hypothetical protein [Phaeodactylibacter sp.]
MPGVLLDLREACALPWPVRFIGYMASDYGYEAKIAVPCQFDGIILINDTSHSRVVD